MKYNLIYSAILSERNTTAAPHNATLLCLRAKRPKGHIAGPKTALCVFMAETKTRNGIAGVPLCGTATVPRSERIALYIPQFTRVHNCDAQDGRWWGNAASSLLIAFHFVWEYRQSGQRCVLEMREERKLVFSQLWTLVNCGIHSFFSLQKYLGKIYNLK